MLSFAEIPAHVRTFTIDNLSLAVSSQVKYLNAQRQVLIYPNPTDDKLIITVAGKIHYVAIYNMVGQEIYNSEYNDKKIEINMTAFPAGTYIVMVNDDSGTKTVRKFVKW